MSAALETTFFLVVYFQVKHFVADFPLQREYMLKKVRPDWSFAAPLATHCLVHSVMTLAICIYYSPQLWWLAVVDFATHFIMDRVKSGPRYLGRFNDRDKHSFWNCFGFDQMVHHLTHTYIIWKIVTFVY